MEWSPTRNEIEFSVAVNEQTLCGTGRSFAHEADFIVRPDGSELRRIDAANDAGPNMRHVWSPDGNQLAFLIGVAGADDVYVLIVTRKGKGALAPYYAEPTEWGPDSKRLAVFLYDPTRSPTGPAVLDVRTMHTQAIGIYASSEITWSRRGTFVANSHEGYVFVERPNGTGRASAHPGCPRRLVRRRKAPRIRPRSRPSLERRLRHDAGRTSYPPDAGFADRLDVGTTRRDVRIRPGAL